MFAFEPLDVRASLNRRTFGLMVTVPFRRWMRAAVKKWQGRTMTAAHAAEDDPTL